PTESPLPCTTLFRSIQTDVDLPPEENLYALREPDRARLREIYTRMEFRGMLRALDAEQAAAGAPVADASAGSATAAAVPAAADRSEEHTSELQSREN